MKLLIGCPVRSREWVLPTWFWHVEASCAEAGIEPSYLFVVDPRDSTNRIIDEISLMRKVVKLDAVDDQDYAPEYEHNWGVPGRLSLMVELRNTLLQGVRTAEPEYFLSLDSDMLATPKMVSNMITTIETDERRFDALGYKAYLAPGKDAPTYALYKRNGGISRRDCEGVFSVNVIMAIKLMTPSAYYVDYEFHAQGEDIGWSLACAEKGLRLGWFGLETCKHVMERSMLGKVDKRCGF